MERYGVKGCELLPDQSCPPGYHKQAVGPPDPRMKAPTVLMCVPDKPEPKEQKEKPAGTSEGYSLELNCHFSLLGMTTRVPPHR
jgi:hypothetical protein